MLEDLVIYEFGHFLYKKESSRNPLNDALLQNESYETCQEYRK